MIDSHEFTAGMAILGGAFGREVDGATGAAYYAVLNPRLRTEQFQRAVEETLATETYWPSPAVLLGKVTGGVHAARCALQAVNAMIARHGGLLDHITPDEVRALGGPTLAAVSAVGGFSAIAATKVEDWPALQRQFVTTYEHVAARQLLATPSADAVLPPPPARALSARTRR